MVTQRDIARKVGLDVSSVSKILSGKPGPVFRTSTIREVHQAARQLGYSLDRIKHHHRRRSTRKAVVIPVVVELFGPGGVLAERGEGLLEDLSKDGARLSRLKLPSGLLPLGGTVGLYSQSTRAAISPRRAEVVRFCDPDGAPGFGLRFTS